MTLSSAELLRAAEIRTQTKDSDTVLLAAQIVLLQDIRALLTEPVERRAECVEPRAESVEPNPVSPEPLPKQTPLELLNLAISAVTTARYATTQGVADDYCVNALKELDSAVKWEQGGGAALHREPAYPAGPCDCGAEIHVTALRFRDTFRKYHSAEHVTTALADALIAARSALFTAVDAEVLTKDPKNGNR